MTIRYFNRATQKMEEEKIYGHRALSLLYGDSWLSRLFFFFFSPLISKTPFFSKLYGSLQHHPRSGKKVDPFIQTYGVDRSEFEEQQFVSFNDFFIRKLKKEKRAIVQDPLCAAMPADGRYLVFPDLRLVKRFYVKEEPFQLSSLLQSQAYGRRYADGSMAIIRLCPTDYHRFHFLDDGIPSKAKSVRGEFHSVNPIALKKNLSILWTNKRMITDFESAHFGKVLYIEVGAICVGTIHQTYVPEQRVNKGDEKGYFSFGGSCIVLLFEKGQIRFDEDLIANSAQGIETRANFGESLGRRP